MEIILFLANVSAVNFPENEIECAMSSYSQDIKSSYFNPKILTMVQKG